MKLVATLLSGIPDAPNGTARISKRGSSQPATVYDDFEATSVRASNIVQLDENGAATVYIGELVDILVFDSNGEQKRSYVEADAAAPVEVISQSFTGADYETGQSGTGKPTTLQAVLDLWKTVNGAPDWKVLIGGNEESVAGALASIVGVFCNVKNPDYGGGASGNGVDDDLDPIEAAIADCDSKGGGTVFFPGGTYRVTDNIEVPASVSLQGAGTPVTTVTLDNAANAILFSLAGSVSSEGFQEIRGLRLVSSQVNSSPLVQYTNARLRLLNCEIGEATNSTDQLVNTTADGTITSCKLQVFACRMFAASGSTGALVTSAAASKILETTIRDSLFSVVGTFDDYLALVETGTVQGCTFDFSAVTSASALAAAISIRSGGNVDGCSFSDCAVSYNCIDGPLDGASSYLVESGSQFGTGADTFIPAPFFSTSDAIQPGSIAERWLETIDNDATFNFFPEYYGFNLLHRTAAGAQVLQANGSWPGQTVTLVIWNDGTGGSISFTWGSAPDLFIDQGGFSVGNNEAVVVTLSCIDFVGAGGQERKLVQVNTVTTMVVP